MARRKYGRGIGALTVVVAVLAVASGVTPSRAFAYQGPAADVILEPGNYGLVESYVTNPIPATVSTDAATQTLRARMSVGLVPLLDRVGVAASGITVGYAIGTGLNEWFDISGSILDNILGTDTACSGPAGVHQIDWTIYDTSPHPWVNSLSWPRVVLEHGGCVASAPIPPDIWVDPGSSDAFAGPMTTFSCGGGPWTLSNIAISGAPGAFANICTITPATLAGALEVTDFGTGSYAGSAGSSVKTIGSYTPPAAPDETDSEADTMRAELLAGDDATDVEIAMAIDPAYEGPVPETFEMPDCEGLTAAACLALLEAEGWVGSSSSNELGIDDAVLALGGSQVTTTNPAAGTGAVGLEDDVELNLNPEVMPLEVQAMLENETAVAYIERIGFAGTVTYVPLTDATGDPLRGPSTAVRITAPAPGGGTRKIAVPLPGVTPGPSRIPNEETTEIEIETNPDTYPPTEAGGPGGCDPWMDAEVDFAPILGLDLGEKFPFGIFVWAEDLLDTFDTTAEAPGWAHHVPDLNVPGAGIYEFDDYEWDLEFFDDYMEIFRTIVSWCLWIGAVYYIGTSLLGIRGTGNPGSAIDDVAIE